MIHNKWSDDFVNLDISQMSDNLLDVIDHLLSLPVEVLLTSQEEYNSTTLYVLPANDHYHHCQRRSIQFQGLGGSPASDR